MFVKQTRFNRFLAAETPFRRLLGKFRQRYTLTYRFFSAGEQPVPMRPEGAKSKQPRTAPWV